MTARLFYFTVFLIGSDDAAQVRRSVEQALQCTLSVDTDNYLAPAATFRGECFGMAVHLEQAEPWEAQQTVYRLAGGSTTRLADDGEIERISMDAHVTDLLRRVGIDEVHLPAEYSRLTDDRRQ